MIPKPATYRPTPTGGMTHDPAGDWVPLQEYQGLAARYERLENRVRRGLMALEHHADAGTLQDILIGLAHG